ncbi:hypothetical protein BC828DRAFT_54634 [Blastocladiella britannica]|nr:hypothetical protein BC828DRAFT_54634 [Blastocladiella britannica]
MSKSLDTIVSPGAVPEPGSGLPRRAAYMGDSPMTGSPENGSNIWELFETTCSKFGDRDFLGHRPIVDGVAQPYAWESYNNSRLRSVNIGSALVHHGIAAETKIGILSVNCPEWILTAFACYRNDFVPVPLYDKKKLTRNKQQPSEPRRSSTLSTRPSSRSCLSLPPSWRVSWPLPKSSRVCRLS